MERKGGQQEQGEPWVILEGRFLESAVGRKQRGQTQTRSGVLRRVRRIQGGKGILSLGRGFSFKGTERHPWGNCAVEERVESLKDHAVEERGDSL